MPAQKFFEGQEFVSDDPAKPTLVYRGGKFFPKSEEPGGMTSAADQPAAPLTPGSENRTRIALGFGPAVEAQKQMYRSEKWDQRPNTRRGVNPLNQDWGAAVIDGADDNILARWAGANTTALAKMVGGQNFQDYDQASKSFESAFLPILSGAAVTPQEAQRLIRANLPQLGDTPETLAKKSRNRAMMINAAADLGGRPRPFPKVGTWDFTGKGGSAPAKPTGPVRVQTIDEARALAPGTVFITPDGRRKVR